MSNIDKAFMIIHDVMKEWPADDVPGVATDLLATQGLLAEDLPAPLDAEEADRTGAHTATAGRHTPPTVAANTRKPST